jgi:hypothetical protein
MMNKTRHHKMCLIRFKKQTYTETDFHTGAQVTKTTTTIEPHPTYPIEYITPYKNHHTPEGHCIAHTDYYELGRKYWSTRIDRKTLELTTNRVNPNIFAPDERYVAILST